MSKRAVELRGTHRRQFPYRYTVDLGGDSDVSPPGAETGIRDRRLQPGASSPGQAGRVALADLDAAPKPSDLDMGGYRLHPLKGDMRGLWSIAVSGNWRIVFRFEDSHAYDVDLIDHH